MNLNKVIILSVVSLILIFFLGGIVYAYKNMGLQYYMRAIYVLAKSPEPQKSQLKMQLYGDSKKLKQYSGLLAGVNTNGLGGIWVWGKFGLSYLPAREGTRFSFVDACSGIIGVFPANNMDKVKDVVLYEPEDFPDVQYWSKRVRVGNLVEVYSDTNVGLLTGNLGGVFAYNGRLTILTGLKTECEK